MRAKEKEFLKAVTPIIKKLNKGWFPPDKKTPDGQHYYACTWCDLNCGQHNKHDDDCLYQLAKNTLEKWDEIENSNVWDKDYKGKKRLPRDISSFKKHAKYRVLFKVFVAFPSYFIALDYKDPKNKRVVCTCSIFEQKRKHHQDCPIVAISKALSNLYKV